MPSPRRQRPSLRTVSTLPAKRQGQYEQSTTPRGGLPTALLTHHNGNGGLLPGYVWRGHRGCSSGRLGAFPKSRAAIPQNWRGLKSATPSIWALTWVFISSRRQAAGGGESGLRAPGILPGRSTTDDRGRPTGAKPNICSMLGTRMPSVVPRGYGRYSNVIPSP